jgi:hypothetical protein
MRHGLRNWIFGRRGINEDVVSWECAPVDTVAENKMGPNKNLFAFFPTLNIYVTRHESQSTNLYLAAGTQPRLPS